MYTRKWPAAWKIMLAIFLLLLLTRAMGYAAWTLQQVPRDGPFHLTPTRFLIDHAGRLTLLANLLHIALLLLAPLAIGLALSSEGLRFRYSPYPVLLYGLITMGPVAPPYIQMTGAGLFANLVRFLQNSFYLGGYRTINVQPSPDGSASGFYLELFLFLGAALLLSQIARHAPVTHARAARRLFGALLGALVVLTALNTRGLFDYSHISALPDGPLQAGLFQLTRDHSLLMLSLRVGGSRLPFLLATWLFFALCALYCARKISWKPLLLLMGSAVCAYALPLLLTPFPPNAWPS